MGWCAAGLVCCQVASFDWVSVSAGLLLWSAACVALLAGFWVLVRIVCWSV